ncbi:MAG: 16S rRNA (cytidine(1402)-2'-O)-methyltransferase [Desulfobulbus propionicus]|nr:MAG: 16S rRNA (cytidine(1402)-2'-O)-methyltransferase [Desulfobulbus propionicus]PIE65552.1 MAG: 16S rRNA (cytidine(1402)-2'-O)-methyltransferase [Desulfobacterales bacterium]
MNTSSLKNDSDLHGQLYVVATPIGNLGEMSSRAVEVLKTVQLIACEDTRHTKKLCTNFGIATPLFSYYREREQQRSEQIMQRLIAGDNIALVSDAGTPCLSDPGAVLVKKARHHNIKVNAVAGPSALAAALSISGLTESAFFFGGFLPSKSSERLQHLQALKTLPYSLIFYESPHRIKNCLQDCIKVFKERQGMLIRELTKIHEECIEGTLSCILERVANGIKGELVLIIDGAPKPLASKPEELKELVYWYRDTQQATLKDTVKSISSDLELPKSKVYKEVLLLWNENK